MSIEVSNLSENTTLKSIRDELSNLKKEIPQEQIDEPKKLEAEENDCKISIDYADPNKVNITYEKSADTMAYSFTIEKIDNTFTIKESHEGIVVDQFDATGDKEVLLKKINEVIDSYVPQPRVAFDDIMIALAMILLPNN